MKRSLTGLLTLALIALALAGCGASAPCMVTATGNKLCGGDAAAWCRATDSIRQGSSDPTLQQTQSDCDSIESQYPSN